MEMEPQGDLGVGQKAFETLREVNRHPTVRKVKKLARLGFVLLALTLATQDMFKEPSRVQGLPGDFKVSAEKLKENVSETLDAWKN